MPHVPCCPLINWLCCRGLILQKLGFAADTKAFQAHTHVPHTAQQQEHYVHCPNRVLPTFLQSDNYLYPCPAASKQSTSCQSVRKQACFGMPKMLMACVSHHFHHTICLVQFSHMIRMQLWHDSEVHTTASCVAR